MSLKSLPVAHMLNHEQHFVSWHVVDVWLFFVSVLASFHVCVSGNSRVRSFCGTLFPFRSSWQFVVVNVLAFPLMRMRDIFVLKLRVELLSIALDCLSAIFSLDSKASRDSQDNTVGCSKEHTNFSVAYSLSHRNLNMKEDPIWEHP